MLNSKYKLVPIEPDDAMIEAGQEALEDKNSWGGRAYASDIWAAMLSAAGTMGSSTPHDLAMAALRSRCKELYQQLGRDQMLRQGDPVETLFAFAKSLINDREYITGFNHGWEECEYQAEHGEPRP